MVTEAKRFKFTSGCVRPMLMIWVILLILWARPVSIWPAEEQGATDKFFKSLILGGAAKGRIYLEVPLKPELFANAKTPEGQQKVWSSFFERALQESADDTPAPYWGSSVHEKIDNAYVASAVELQVGDAVMVRTAAGMGTATIIGYQVHHGISVGELLLAVARPDTNFKVPDTDLLAAARILPPCRALCANHRTQPDPFTVEKIRAVARRGARISENEQFKQATVLQGHFTRRDSLQYVVYATFGIGGEQDPIHDHWRTLILDADLSVVALLGENEYTHIIPTSVGDISGDGLDEIWVNLGGYEGRRAGIYYWRGGRGRGAFGRIMTSYNGV